MFSIEVLVTDVVLADDETQVRVVADTSAAYAYRFLFLPLKSIGNTNFELCDGYTFLH